MPERPSDKRRFIPAHSTDWRAASSFWAASGKRVAWRTCRATVPGTYRLWYHGQVGALVGVSTRQPRCGSIGVRWGLL